MKPLIRSGSLLWFTAREAPRLGDVVLVRLPNDRLLAHRVVSMDAERIWTKGDACRTADLPMPRSSVLGRAVRLEGSVALPLSRLWMRALGLLLGRVYPRIVSAYRSIVPARGEESASC